MDGATVRRISELVMSGIKNAGGASVSWSAKPAPSTGFMVGGLVSEEIVKVDEFLRDNVVGFIWLHLNNLTETNNRYVGAWVNTDTGNVHLDISERWTTYSEAMQAARMRGELAVWDLQYEKEIRLLAV
jgi:hypothetical protein